MGEEMRAVLKLVCLPLRQLASELDLGYDAVRAWSSGRYVPSIENRQALAKFMRKHAKKLIREAEKLEAMDA